MELVSTLSSRGNLREWHRTEARERLPIGRTLAVVYFSDPRALPQDRAAV